MASLFYKTVKLYCSTALKFYFREWVVTGVEKIPECPVIFVPNHQNAFLDAILVTCSSVKNPWFLTRANVFNKPSAAKMLNMLQMLPVYRFRDGYATLRKNEQVMDNIVKQIDSGESILIFAEGSYNERNNLSPLQKGVARIALASDKNKKIAIVPVGLNYESRTRYRSKVLVNFGNPVVVDHKALSHLNAFEQVETLMNSIRNELQILILHIDNDRYEEKWNYLRKHRQFKPDLKSQLMSDQEIINTFPGPSPLSVPPKKSPVIQKIIKGYATINNFIFLFITGNFVLTKIKDPQFIGSIKYACGLFLVPLFWLLQSLLLLLISGSGIVAFIYFLSLPLSLKFS